MEKTMESSGTSDKLPSKGDRKSPQRTPPATGSITRSLALVDYIEFKFDGNMNKYGLALGDCDNDQKNELVLGTLNGELLVFKDDCASPQASTKDLGMIACVLVGDVLNLGSNFIVSLNINGYLNVFQMHNDCQVDSMAANSPKQPRTPLVRFSNAMPSNVKLPPTIADNEIPTTPLTPTTKLILVHSQQLQANAMCGMIVDLDQDGQNEFIVALSDRVVRCYRANTFADNAFKLVGLYKWEFADQIGAITLHNSWLPPEEDGGPPRKKSSILVSQFDSLFAKITCCSGDDDCVHSNEEIEHTIEYCPEVLPYMRNAQISAEILSDIKVVDPGDEGLIAFATHDGNLILLNTDHTVKWRLQLEYPILALQKYDVNEDGTDELIVCTWNGLVYIVDLRGNIIACHFHEPISSFVAGRYHLGGVDSFSLVFTTFTNSVRLYYNQEPLQFNIDTSRNYLMKNIERNEILKQKLEKLSQKLNDKCSDDAEKVAIVPDLIRSLLYDVPD